jgi:hypothetical protein
MSRVKKRVPPDDYMPDGSRRKLRDGHGHIREDHRIESLDALFSRIAHGYEYDGFSVGAEAGLLGADNIRERKGRDGSFRDTKNRKISEAGSFVAP